MDIVRAGYNPPTGMSDTDRLCKECLIGIRKTQVKNKKAKKDRMKEENKKVSIFWQCVATLFFIPGLWGFNRIKKLRKGILLTILSYGLWFNFYATTATIALFSNTNAGIFSYISTLGFGIMGLASLPLSFVIPIYYMRKWSKEWNESIDKQNMQPSELSNG